MQLPTNATIGADATFDRFVIYDCDSRVVYRVEVDYDFVTVDELNMILVKFRLQTPMKMSAVGYGAPPVHVLADDYFTGQVTFPPHDRAEYAVHEYTYSGDTFEREP